MTTTKRPPRVVLTGHYNTLNFGDILIAELMGRRLAQMTGAPPICPWVHPDVAPDVSFAAGKGWSDCHGQGAVFGGGGYLNDIILGGGSKRLLKYDLTSRLFRLTRTPYAVAGVGAGPECTPKGGRRIRSVVANARRAGVRDDESIEFLVTRCGVPAEHLTRTADLALAMTRDDLPAEAASRVEALLPPKQAGETRLCVHLQVLSHMAHLVPGIIRAVAESIRGTSIRPVFLFDNGRGTHDIIKQHRDDLLPEAPILLGLPYWDVAAAIAACDAALTTKLHVGIVAWAFGVPACSLSFHGKTKRFYKQIGRQDFQADLDENTQDRARDWLGVLDRDPRAFKEESARARVELPRLAELNYQLVAQTLTEAGLDITYDPGANG